MGPAVVDWRIFPRIDMRKRSLFLVDWHVRRYRRSSSKGLITHWMSILKCRENSSIIVLFFHLRHCVNVHLISLRIQTIHRIDFRMIIVFQSEIPVARVTYRNESNRCRSFGIIELKLVGPCQDITTNRKRTPKQKSVSCATRNNWHEERRRWERER